MKVYVKVKASDPPEDGQGYFVLQDWNCQLVPSIGIYFKDTGWVDLDTDDMEGVEYWLKEIDLPDEDEIVAMSGNLTALSKLFNKAKLPKEIKDAIYEVAQDSFKIGANYILNDLK